MKEEFNVDSKANSLVISYTHTYIHIRLLHNLARKKYEKEESKIDGFYIFICNIFHKVV